MRDIWGLGVEGGGFFGGDLDGFLGGDGGVDMSFGFAVGCSWWL